MNGAQRWPEAVAKVKEALAAHEAGDTSNFITLFEEYCNILEAIVVDPQVAETDRASAAAVLERILEGCRAMAPQAVRVLAGIARNPTADAHDRAEATTTLERAVEQWPAGSDKVH
jgi:hypothetical protein